MAKHGEAYILSPERRMFDITAGGLILALGAPAVAASAVVLGPDVQGKNPILKQRRIGKGYVPISILKLLTFVEQDFNATADTFGVNNPHASRNAKLIRRIGLDELPQAVNVLQGDMSIFGIRPQIESLLEQRRCIDKKLFDDWYEWYGINIGLLGPGQNFAHSVGSYAENSDVVRRVMELDIHGCETASLTGEIRALVQTPLEALNGVAAMIQARAPTNPS